MKKQIQGQWDAAYVRVSTEMQVERDALQNQVQALEARGLADGLNLRFYRDEGISAKDTDRPQLQRLVADVRTGHVRSVLVTKLDRISRSLFDLLELMRLFEKHDVKFLSLRDNIDTAGPVGRFILHILGAIAELERGIIGERVAEDMKLRAKRGKWNGGLTPYGRMRMDDGKIEIVPEEAEVLHRMRNLLLRVRTWRGVAVALNRDGFRTRGWESKERDGRVVRRGHAPAEWTTVSVKRVLLQPINAGTLVYNRRTVKGKTSVPRPAEEHVVVEDFCEPIFTHQEMDELVRLAAEIHGTPSRTLGSPHLLSGLVECVCGSKMYGMHSWVKTKRGSYQVGYYRCRRANNQGTCDARQIPAAVVERVVMDELRRLGLDQDRLAGFADGGQAILEQNLGLAIGERGELAGEIERIEDRLASLLELAEERLISKPEFATRKGQLESERAILHEELVNRDSEILARSASTIDVRETVRGLRRLADVFDELDDVVDRRRLLATCLSRVVVRPGEFQLHVLASPLLLAPLEAHQKVPGKVDSGTAKSSQKGPGNPKNGAIFPAGIIGSFAQNYGASECIDVDAAHLSTGSLHQRSGERAFRARRGAGRRGGKRRATRRSGRG